MPNSKHNPSEFSPSRHLNFAEGSYLESTSRPLYALMFLLPMIIIYEIGTIFVNTDQLAQTQTRVATFSWLMSLAQWIGLDRKLTLAFPGMVVVVILFCWHMASHHAWKINFKWLFGMVIESIALTLPLFALGPIMSSTLASHDIITITLSASEAPTQSSPFLNYLANLTTSIGAGIYEELVFRLIVLGLVLMLLEDFFKVKKISAVLMAVAISSLLFAGHHYVGFVNGQFSIFTDEPFTLNSFIFRTLSGVYFAYLFRFRGFGIIAGTHAAYDMIYFTLRLT